MTSVAQRPSWFTDILLSSAFGGCGRLFLMEMGSIIALVVAAAVLAGLIWVAYRKGPSAADERVANEQLRQRGMQDVSDVQRRPGAFGGS